MYLYQMKEDVLNNWEKKSAEKQKIYKQFLQRADKNKVLKALPVLHEQAFEKVNCLTCANCCKAIRRGLKHRILSAFPGF